MIKVGLIGFGRTGKEIGRAILEQKDMELVSVICSPESSKEGMDVSEVLQCKETGIIIQGAENLENVIFQSKPDVVVDFSNPMAALSNAKKLSQMKVNIVIGTTGFSGDSMEELYTLTRKHKNGIVYAPNITLGVNVLMLLTNLAANILSNYDFQITEIHHKYKKDSPSGTAIKIAKEIEKGLLSSGVGLDSIKIPINAVRAGGVIGKHEVMVIGEDDKIEISHESFSRKAFALGAIKAVKFVNNKCGYYEMNDVLDLQRVLTDYLGNDRSVM
jgi:4-hydroxy-tetrahydrodipicolinate reductase